MKPLALDLCCGRGGWAKGLIAAGWRVIGFDIEDMGYLQHPDCQLVLQNILTIDGHRLRSGALIVASPPCQKYSWLAMPWSRSKSDGSQAAKVLRRKWETEGPDNALFDACFRIAREAGLPLVVENVKGAQEWVGPAKAHYGSFYLWGDVESVGSAIVASHRIRFGESLVRAGKARKNEDAAGGTWFGVSHGKEYPGQPGNPVKQNGSGPVWFDTGIAKHSSRSAARKEASANIAMIPFDLAYHIGRVFHPEGYR